MDGVQAIPVSRGAGREGLHTGYDRGRTGFQGETEGMGDMTEVLEGSGEGVTGSAPSKSARRGKIEVGTGGQQGSRP